MSFNIRYFGASHAPEAGLVAEGLPQGETFSVNFMRSFLDRRRPGTSDQVSGRCEKDEPEFQSGVRETGSGTFTLTGEPLRISIRNTDADPSTYHNLNCIPRPGHADYTSWLKYGEWPSGGGVFSGRMTAPLCVLGAICLEALQRRGIMISARIVSTGDIEAARETRDSVGGIAECTASGVPAGLGGPFTEGLESRLSAAVFGIPAVKGIEFGTGFALAGMKGSESNDPFILKDGRVETLTNHCGGILGGISTGMPIVFRAVFKPTPSISLPQKTVNLQTGEETTIIINGRHDPCVVLRALPVLEAVTAVTLLEVLQEESRL